MEILQQLHTIKIPDIYFFAVESFILLYVYLDYRLAIRKPGRPKKSKIQRFMNKLSKKFRIKEIVGR